MNRAQRLITSIVVILSMFVLVDAAVAAAKSSHHSGHQLLGNKIKTNGNHVIDKVGKHTVSVNVTNGKVAGLNVKHSEKGDVPVKKYKTTKKLAQSDGIHLASYPDMLAQSQDLGMTYIGYSFIDDYGNEQIYWFPYEMILDGDTGAIEYVALT
jgi:hypothetical protein